jgi:hypothetical protein
MFMSSNPLPRPSLKKLNWSERIQIFSLLTIALIGIIIALVSLYTPIFEFIVTIFPFLKSVNLTALILLVFSTVAIAIGLERYEVLDKAREEALYRHSEITQAITQIQSIVSRDIPNLESGITQLYQILMSTVGAVRVLEGHEVVYDEAVRLIKKCKSSDIIRSTSLDLYSNPETMTFPYKSYLETIAEVIGEGKHKKLGMAHKVVMGFRTDEHGEPPPKNKQTISARRNAFKRYDALDRLYIKYVESSWFVSLLIVGDDEMIFGFPTSAGDSRIRLGIRITDRVFVGSVVRWYEEYLWQVAKDVTWTDQDVQQ